MGEEQKRNQTPFSIRLSEEEQETIRKLQERLEARRDPKRNRHPTTRKDVILEALDALQMRLDDLERPRRGKRA